MITLTRLSAEHIAAKPLTIHLCANKSGNPVEIEGAGYAPKTLTGTLKADGTITYPTAVFLFTGPLGWVFGWYATIDGEQVEGEGEIFDAPFFVGGKGFKIRIPFSVEQ